LDQINVINAYLNHQTMIKCICFLIIEDNLLAYTLYI